MPNPDHDPAGAYDHWSIAGYGDREQWCIVEGQEADSPPPDESDLSWIDEVIVHITDDNGIDWYYSLYGPWEDWESFGDMVDDLWEGYGGEAV